MADANTPFKMQSRNIAWHLADGNGSGGFRRYFLLFVMCTRRISVRLWINIDLELGKLLIASVVQRDANRRVSDREHKSWPRGS